MLKTCVKCNVEKDCINFYFRKDNMKYRNECKKCLNTKNAAQKASIRERNKSNWQKNKDAERARYKTWYKHNYEKEGFSVRRRNNHYKKYGLTADQYMEIHTEQRGLCGICKQGETFDSSGKVKRLAIDHCHTTGKVRGLLCQNCNRGIGLLKENIKVLERAIKYIENEGDI